MIELKCNEKKNVRHIRKVHLVAATKKKEEKKPRDEDDHWSLHVLTYIFTKNV